MMSPERRKATTLKIGPGGLFKGELSLPGDKSIAHRALIFAALSPGRCRISNLPTGDDVKRTAQALRILGVQIDITGDVATVYGTGGAFAMPTGPIDCGNSGTTMRLMTGLIAGAGINARLIGDESLSRRPMNRIIEPLREMGAHVKAEGVDGRPPLVVSGGIIEPGDYQMPVPSAQVKSAIILAALYAQGETLIRQPAPSRDHTERMLADLGIDIVTDGEGIAITGPALPESFDMRIPGDPSSAAFFAAGAACKKDSEIKFTGLSINPQRLEFFRLLKKAGVIVEVIETGQVVGEPVGDVTVSFGGIFKPMDVDGYAQAGAIDEILLVAVTGVYADGKSHVKNALELRLKESDRIKAVCRCLDTLGIGVVESEDGFQVKPGMPRNELVDSADDHRIAMAMAILGACGNGVSITNADVVNTSYPEFVEHLGMLCPHCDISWE